MSEAAHQAALFRWARMPAVLATYPGIDMLEGSMNGVHLHPVQALKAMRAGMLKGAPDIRLPVPRKGFNGLAIELKYAKNAPSADQLRILHRLRENGYFCLVCWDWVDAKWWIERYLMYPKHDG